MEREEFIRVAIQVSTWEKGTIPFRAAFDQLIAEFDRLTAENEKLSTKVATLQSQLDKISLPIKTDGDVGHIRRTVIPLLREQCKDISAQTLERVLDYLNSQETKEKPARCEHENGGISYYSAVIKGVIKQWCADCKEWT